MGKRDQKGKGIPPITHGTKTENHTQSKKKKRQRKRKKIGLQRH